MQERSMERERTEPDSTPDDKPVHKRPDECVQTNRRDNLPLGSNPGQTGRGRDSHSQAGLSHNHRDNLRLPP